MLTTSFMYRYKVKCGMTASKCPIGSMAFRSYPCGTNHPWDKHNPYGWKLPFIFS
ncbi:hypothetical protein GCM10008934_27810 [Virgibacillus salarius]